MYSPLDASTNAHLGDTWQVGTPLFTAPEMQSLLMGFSSATDTYDAAVDVWALGCLLACLNNDATLPYSSRGPGPPSPSEAYATTLATSDAPKTSPSQQSMQQRIASGSLAPCVPPHSPLHDLVGRCCRHQSSERPSALDILAVLDCLVEEQATAAATAAVDERALRRRSHERHVGSDKS